MHLTPDLSSGPYRILGFTEFPFHHVSAITVHTVYFSRVKCTFTGRNASLDLLHICPANCVASDFGKRCHLAERFLEMEIDTDTDCLVTRLTRLTPACHCKSVVQPSCSDYPNLDSSFFSLMSLNRQATGEQISIFTHDWTGLLLSANWRQFHFHPREIGARRHLLCCKTRRSIGGLSQETQHGKVNCVSL